MATTTVTLTDAGRSALNDLIVASQPVEVTKYEIGDQAAYTPTASQTTVQGNLVFDDQSAGASSVVMTVTKTGDYTFSVNLLLDSTIGDFTVGECIFKLDDGTPLAIVVLSQTTEKVQTAGSIVGNTLNLAVTLTILNAGNNVSVTLSSTVHNSINEILDESGLPAIASGSSNVYLVRNYNSTGLPAIAYKDITGGVWKFFLQNTIKDTDVSTLTSVGSYLLRASDTSIANYLNCEGAAISRTTYADLFSVIGVTFGAGDGSTTFNLPDFRGKVFGGAGFDPNLTSRALGDFVGSETHTLTLPELPNFVIKSPTLLSDADRGSLSSSFSLDDITTYNIGSDQPHNIMQPTLFGGYLFIRY